MSKYKVQWKYSSGLGGPWLAGDIVDLSVDLADYINRDSPGVLKPVKETAKEQTSKSAEKPKDKTGKGGKNRMVTQAKNRDVVMGRDQPGYGQELLPNSDES